MPGTSRLLSNLVKMFAANALGRMRAVEAGPAIQALVSTTNPQDEDVTTLAAEALVWLGDRAQARELMKKAQKGLVKPRVVVAQAAALFGEPALGNDLATLATRESKGSPPACVRQLGELALVIDDPRQACSLLAAQFSELAKPLDAARVCGAEAPCWLMSDKLLACALRDRLRKRKQGFRRVASVMNLARRFNAGSRYRLVSSRSDD